MCVVDMSVGRRSVSVVVETDSYHCGFELLTHEFSSNSKSCAHMNPNRRQNHHMDAEERHVQERCPTMPMQLAVLA